MKKYIFVTGGVCSSLGKGIAAASIGTLLESRGYRVAMVKIDPYLNVDAGTMSPYQHGEVFVTDDGAETDLDLGNYSRFTSSPLGRAHSITTGQIYQTVINKEREGRYLGRTVQVIPHITDEIKSQIVKIGNQPEIDITIVEVGGTVGDIESVPFLETARQCIHEFGHENVLSVHLTLVPAVSGNELKTKPTQHSVKELREIGIQPDILLCRAKRELDDSMRRKIANFTNVSLDSVLSAIDVNTTIYEIPLIYHKQKLDEIVLRKLNLELREANLEDWSRLVEGYKNTEKTVTIAMVGKYIDLHDTYKSVDEALVHAGMSNRVKVKIKKIDAEKLEKGAPLEEIFAGADAVLIPGGFGSRGVEGMVQAARYARENRLPYLGICLGMQIMVIEYARTVLGLETANSSEFDEKTPHPVVSLLEEQEGLTKLGGTMRLGRSATHTVPGTVIARAYGEDVIWERHRHRYEFSNAYRHSLGQAGLKISGLTPDSSLVESVEWPDHPWSTGVQFHPEFSSKPTRPQPLFRAFVAAAAAGK
jgi:CTP synthase